MLTTPVAWLPAWSVRAVWVPVAPPRVSPRLLRSVRASADELTVSTFNLWCPAYRRVNGDDDVRESEFPELYMPRHREILGLDVWNTSDIVCCQEFWYASQDLFDLYVNTLQPRYRMHGLRRSGARPDGLFMAISREWEVVHEADLDFEDAAGRCAQLLHLKREVDSDDASSNAITELLVANVHLLFPHNEAAGRVRLREMHKVLAYLEFYKTKLDAPPPTLICGDLNGPTGSVVAQSLARYGWQDSYSSHAGCNIEQLSEGEGCGWVSHLNHLGVAEGVDYIMVQSPSTRRLPVADWTDFVMAEIAQALTDRGHGEAGEAWRMFTELACSAEPEAAWAGGGSEGEGGSEGGLQDREADGCLIDCEGFNRALQQLGFGAAPLTIREVDVLVSSCDADGNGVIDATEWRDRFAAALQRLQTDELVQDQRDGPELSTRSSVIFPACLEQGRWPAEDQWGLSDHGVVTSTFVLGDPDE